MSQSSHDMNRRNFVQLAAAAGIASAASSLIHPVFGQNYSHVPWPKLPYGVGALEPYISAKTIKLHYQKHHGSYFRKVNAWVSSREDLQGKSLETIIGKTKWGGSDDESIHHMAILLYNHNLYWKSMKPNGGGEPEKRSTIGKLINESFSSFEILRTRILAESRKLGSGWVWLVKAEDRLRVMHTAYHETPLVHYFKPLFVIDVWEHAYYLDYYNDKEKYVNAFVDHLVNWNFVESQLGV